MRQRKCLKDPESRIGCWGWLLHVPPQTQTKTKTKSSETAGKPASKPRSSNPIDIPLKDFSPEVRKLLILGMVKGGKAKVVKRKKDKDEKSKEKK